MEGLETTEIDQTIMVKRLAYTAVSVGIYFRYLPDKGICRHIPAKQIHLATIGRVGKIPLPVLKNKQGISCWIIYKNLRRM